MFDDAKAREHYMSSRIYVEVAGAHATRLCEKKRLSKKPMKWRLGKRKQQRQKKKYWWLSMNWSRIPLLIMVFNFDFNYEDLMLHMIYFTKIFRHPLRMHVIELHIIFCLLFKLYLMNILSVLTAHLWAGSLNRFLVSSLS